METSASDDTGGVDESRQLMYMKDHLDNPAGIIAIAALDHTPSGYVFYSIDPVDAAHHYSLLTCKGISEAGGPADYRMLLNTGPFVLGPGDSCRVSFGIVMGGTLDQLNINANTMRAVFAGMLTSDFASEETLPSTFALGQNFPNPFNPETHIRYRIARTADVYLSLHDILGREVKILVNEKNPPGEYEVTLDATGLATGVYFYRLTAGSFVETRKMIVVK
jgi:hypothetical protein